MIALRASRARQQRREILLTHLLTLPLPLLAFGLGMVALELSGKGGTANAQGVQKALPESLRV